MNSDLNNLSEYVTPDIEKRQLIDKLLPGTVFHSKKQLFAEEIVLKQMEMHDVCYPAEKGIQLIKICPKCGRKYPNYENFCFDCDVKLKDVEDVNVKNIEICHEFTCKGSNAFEEFTDILTQENIIKINEFQFEMSDFDRIIKAIRSKALKNLDNAIKENEISLDDLTILEKVILFTKSFVDVEYKSYGAELGYYSFNKIHVDDRQLDSLQITTMLHELTHFLNKEILTHILCHLLDASKTREMESVIAFILSFSSENCLIDEYAAHTVEGRFTLFGYQDYSSFLSIQNTIERTDDEIEMLKTIANSLANVIKGIIESFIDDELLSDIKVQFRKDILDDPNYAQLKLENCTLLNDEGLLRAIQFVLLEGFAAASQNVGKLMELNEMW
ncbi:hypothetical protein [Methanobrevibacter sp.]|uniref:hypothetical protein n=1 Tax=Methanobrevibacter sp. TaxID=66852 RepID=UPI00386DC437